VQTTTDGGYILLSASGGPTGGASWLVKTDSSGNTQWVLVLSDEPMFPGCQVECRIVGVLKAKQRENGKQNRNDRLIALAEGSVLYGEWMSYRTSNRLYWSRSNSALQITRECATSNSRSLSAADLELPWRSRKNRRKKQLELITSAEVPPTQTTFGAWV
jgi:hypothetical protein